VRTSAKARLTSVVTRIRIRDPDRHQNLIICSLDHCQPSWKFHANPFGSFCAKLLTDIQRNKQRRLHALLSGDNYNDICIMYVVIVGRGRAMALRDHAHYWATWTPSSISPVYTIQPGCIVYTNIQIVYTAGCQTGLYNRFDKPVERTVAVRSTGLWIRL